MADEPLPNDPVVNPDGTIQPLSSGGIVRGLVSIFSFFVLAYAFVQKVKTDPKSVTGADLQQLATSAAIGFGAIYALYMGVRNILKRIEVGKDPANPAPPIAAPKLVQRLTNGKG